MVLVRVTVILRVGFRVNIKRFQYFFSKLIINPHQNIGNILKKNSFVFYNFLPKF